MIHLQRKLKCKYVGPDNYIPENMNAFKSKYLPVVGYESRKIFKKKIGKEGEREVEEVFFLVIDDTGKITKVAAFNCSVIVDDKSEIDANQIVELLRNIVIMAKILSEKIGKDNDVT